MSNDDIPWYRSHAFLAAVVAIVAIVVTVVIWRFPYPSPPSDFRIFADPMRGEVQQGGVITTEICIECIHGYKYPVSPIASGQPPGVVFTFVPPTVAPTPPYTSTANINVDSSVPAGVYTIIVEGAGADGKKHSCNYFLTVNPVTPKPTPTPSPSPPPTSAPPATPSPSPPPTSAPPATPSPSPSPTPTPTPTPSPSPTPTPTPRVAVTAPTDGENVSMSYFARGTHSGLIDNPGLNLYVLVHPHTTDKWWVQNLPAVFSDGSWQTTIYFGTETQGIGDDYTVSAIITTEDLEVAEILSSLPSYVAESHVTVTRPI